MGWVEVPLIPRKAASLTPRTAEAVHDPLELNSEPSDDFHCHDSVQSTMMQSYQAERHSYLDARQLDCGKLLVNSTASAICEVRQQKSAGAVTEA
jgi:hypothetical protein